MRDFLNTGLTFAIRYFDDLKQYYQKVFAEYDSDFDGYIDFDSFSSLIKKLD